MGDGQASTALCDSALSVLDRHHNEGSRPGLLSVLGTAFMNKALVMLNRGDFREAIPVFDRGIAVLEQNMVDQANQHLEPILVAMWINRAIAIETAGDVREAISQYTRSIERLERLVEREGQSDFACLLARAYVNKAAGLERLPDLAGAADLYDRAIAIRERLVHQGGESDIAEDLGRAYCNKANIIGRMGDHRGALACFDRAIQVLDRLVRQEGRSELAVYLARTCRLKGLEHVQVDERKTANKLFDDAIEILERLSQKDDAPYADELGIAYHSRGMTANQDGDHLLSSALFDRAIDIWECHIRTNRSWQYVDELCLLYQHKQMALSNLKDVAGQVTFNQRACDMLSYVVEQEKQHKWSEQLADIYCKLAISMFRGCGDPKQRPEVWLAAHKHFVKSYSLYYEQLLLKDGREDIVPALSEACRQYADVLTENNILDVAEDFHKKAVWFVSRLVQEHGRADLSARLAQAKLHLAIPLRRQGKMNEAQQEISEAVRLLHKDDSDEARKLLTWAAHEFKGMV
jgi:tetratricopeptide (TPR) repeat protein